MSVETVTIPKKEYEDLLDSQLELNCIHSAGVDNWCGYSDAMEMKEQQQEEAKQCQS